jgi:putative acetyltransferase
MINIVPIQPQHITDAKYVISGVAQRIYEPEKTIQEFYNILEEEGELNDVDNYQQVYFNNHGLFLVVLDDNRLVGTGAIKRLDSRVAELKRLWLLEEYHGKKVGYQVTTRLLDFARAQKYERVRLQTGHNQQRAIRFYKRLGFYEIPSYRKSMDNLSMEIKL